MVSYQALDSEISTFRVLYAGTKGTCRNFNQTLISRRLPRNVLHPSINLSRVIVRRFESSRNDLYRPWGSLTTKSPHSWSQAKQLAEKNLGFMSNRCLGNHIKIQRHHWNFRLLNVGRLNQPTISEFLHYSWSSAWQCCMWLCVWSAGSLGQFAHEI